MNSRLGCCIVEFCLINPSLTLHCSQIDYSRKTRIPLFVTVISCMNMILTVSDDKTNLRTNQRNLGLGSLIVYFFFSKNAFCVQTIGHWSLTHN